MYYNLNILEGRDNQILEQQGFKSLVAVVTGWALPLRVSELSARMRLLMFRCVAYFCYDAICNKTGICNTCRNL